MVKKTQSRLPNLVKKLTKEVGKFVVWHLFPVMMKQRGTGRNRGSLSSMQEGTCDYPHSPPSRDTKVMNKEEVVWSTVDMLC